MALSGTKFILAPLLAPVRGVVGHLGVGVGVVGEPLHHVAEAVGDLQLGAVGRGLVPALMFCAWLSVPATDDLGDLIVDDDVEAPHPHLQALHGLVVHAQVNAGPRFRLEVRVGQMAAVRAAHGDGAGPPTSREGALKLVPKLVYRERSGALVVARPGAVEELAPGLAVLARGRSLQQVDVLGDGGVPPPGPQDDGCSRWNSSWA